MAATIVPQPTPQAAPSAAHAQITRERIGQIVRDMRHACRYDTREVNAINRAMDEFNACIWIWDAASETLIIESRSTMFRKYRITATTCETTTGEPCKARGVHWHRAAWTILHRASQPDVPRAPRYTAADHARHQALVDELF